MTRLPGVCRVFAFLTVAACAAWGNSVTLLTSRAGLPDSVDWGQLGGSGTFIPGPFSAVSASGNHVSGSFTNGAMIFTGFGELAGAALWDANSGPVTLTFSSAVSAVVFNITPDYTYVSGSGPFKAQITAFSGAVNLGSVTAQSNVNGANLFLGVSDTVAEITSIQIDGLLEANHFGSASTTDAHDFAINALSLSAPAAPTSTGAPEPSGVILMAGGALLVGLMRRRSS